jgi:hypothetical protein
MFRNMFRLAGFAIGMCNHHQTPQTMSSDCMSRSLLGYLAVGKWVWGMLIDESDLGVLSPGCWC